jgi:hypothetical protein
VFIEALADCGSVTRAALGKSVTCPMTRKALPRRDFLAGGG